MAASDNHGSDQERPRRNVGSRDRSEKEGTSRDETKQDWARREPVWRSRGEGKSDEARRDDAGERRPPEEGAPKEGFPPRERSAAPPREAGPRESNDWRERGGGAFRDRENTAPRRESTGPRESNDWRERGGGAFRDRENTAPRRESTGPRESNDWRERSSGGFRDRESGGFRDRSSGPREGGGFRDRESGGPREGGGFRDRESSGPREGGGFRDRESGGFRDRSSGPREGGGFRDRESGGPREGGGFRDRESSGHREGGGFRDRESSGPRRESGGWRDRGASEGRERPAFGGEERGGPRREFGPRFSREDGPRRDEGARGEDAPRREGFAPREDRRDDRRDDRERRPYRSSSPYPARYGSGGSRFRTPRPPLKKKKKVRVFFHQALTRILLPKLLTKAKYLSPRLAKMFIETGRVRVNARIVSSPYYEVNLRKERVTIDEAATEYPRRLCYMIYNKPRNVVCEKSDPVFNEIFESEGAWSFPFGRLTKSASGLVVLSNDPRMVKRQHTVDIELQKEYRIKLNKTLTEEQLDELSLGVLVGDEYLVPLRVSPVRENKNSMWIDITLLDDSYQRLYGAFKVLGAEVLAMRRTRIALINEQMVPPGEWRELSGFEIAALGIPKFTPGELPPEPLPPMKPRTERKPPFKKDARDGFRRGGERGERGGERGGWDRRPGGPGGRRPAHGGPGGYRSREEEFEDRQREEAEADAIGNK